MEGHKEVKKVVVIHTTPITIHILKPHFEKYLPEVKLVNFLDDSLLNDTRDAGKVTKDVLKRITSFFRIAEESGADIILSACSSVGETIDYARQMVKIPIIKIDEPSIEKALQLGNKIAVIGTLRTTLEPTTRLVKRKAEEAELEVDITQALCDEAYDLLMAGQKEAHDNALRERIGQLISNHDAIILAQASMSQLELDLPEEAKRKILTTPENGVLKVKEIMQKG